jgi:uncharacterized membrane protein YdbT with pleckstrin-like domain
VGQSGVPISRKLLNTDESVLVSTRTHGKALIAPLVVLIVLASLAGLLSNFTGGAGRAQPLLVAVIWGLAGLAALRWVLAPFLAWLTTTYTVTDQRLITRSGVVTRRGHDIPLPRISDVAYERSLLDRVLGCGTLLVSVASEQRVALHDIPHVEHVHLRMQDLLHDGVPTQVIDRRDGGAAGRTSGGTSGGAGAR